MSLLPFFTSRYSCKRFDSTQKVSRRDIEVLIETARLAPTALGISVVRLIHVQNPTLREELKTHSLNQSPITDASEMFVFAVKTEFTQEDIDNYILYTAQIRQCDIVSLDDHKKLVEKVVGSFSSASFLEWAQRQAYTALGFVLTQCAVIGIDSSPIGLFDAKKYNEILGLDAQGLHAAIILTVGYRSSDDVYQTLPKVRIDRKQFLSTLI